MVGCDVWMALQHCAGVALGLQEAGDQGVLERADGEGLGLVGGELPERGWERGAPRLAVLPEPQEEAVQVRESDVAGAGEGLVRLDQVGFDSAND